ncbi:hypothetical protein [Metamycoplasma gateae]|uniref:Uncharacterized protein n=1 Tax=Metamycoplasma gateae TaxID=35769 RepID=A0ABZ2AKL7_9BACT|nr:hypothetical protein V2E26_02500 [Metamycoplasma gateae]
MAKETVKKSKDTENLKKKITKDFEKTGTIKSKDLNKLVQDFKNSKK